MINTGKKQDVLQRLGPEPIPTVQLPANLSPNGKITALNTTLIGDKTIQNFVNPDPKWLIQCIPSLTFSELKEKIEDNSIDIQKRYIFILVGGNDFGTYTKMEVWQHVKMIAYAIFSRNPVAKVFWSGILPQYDGISCTKDHIIKFNRRLCAAICRIKKEFERCYYIPTQLRFHGPTDGRFFDDNILNQYGCLRLKMGLLEGAGFIQNP